MANLTKLHNNFEFGKDENFKKMQQNFSNQTQDHWKTKHQK